MVLKKSCLQRCGIEMSGSWGTWAALSVKCLTLHVSSGLEGRVVCTSSMLGSMLDVGPT